MLREAFSQTDQAPPQTYSGAHVLRHSLATEMLRRGASMDEVRDALRHRSRSTTALYAKYGLEALRELAPEWPKCDDADRTA
ncbi:tyrosine-type recombinase/integrase [Cerasicoccus arenae]|nr:tyrosine-type recombinase/integrase [Cerasicoccus arenae]